MSSMMMKKMCGGHKVAWILVLIGALNWGVIGAVGVNPVNMLLGSMSWLERLVYILVGLSALAMLFMHKCKMCMMMDKGMMNDKMAMKGPDAPKTM